VWFCRYYGVYPLVVCLAVTLRWLYCVIRWWIVLCRLDVITCFLYVAVLVVGTCYLQFPLFCLHCITTGANTFVGLVDYCCGVLPLLALADYPFVCQIGSLWIVLVVTLCRELPG